MHVSAVGYDFRYKKEEIYLKTQIIGRAVNRAIIGDGFVDSYIYALSDEFSVL